MCALPASIYVHDEHVVASGVQKRALVPGELEFQVFVSHHVCVLGIKPESSGRQQVLFSLQPKVR